MNAIAPSRCEPLEPAEANLLCHYINTSAQLQVVRIEASARAPFERVVFPGQRLFFEAQNYDSLDVYSGECNDIERVNRLSCQDLACQA